MSWIERLLQASGGVSEEVVRDAMEIGGGMPPRQMIVTTAVVTALVLVAPAAFAAIGAVNVCAAASRGMRRGEAGERSI